MILRCNILHELLPSIDNFIVLQAIVAICLLEFVSDLDEESLLVEASYLAKDTL